MAIHHTENIRFIRKLVQFFFLTVVLYIGFEFAVFVHQLGKGILPSLTRPPGVEAFLPISALISLKYWVVTGVFNRIHPSGLIFFLTVLSTALFLKRGFCSWVCPMKKLELPKNHDTDFRVFRSILAKFLAGEKAHRAYVTLDAEEMVFKRHDRSVPIPFGPYLAAAGWIAMLWGERVKNFYLDLML